MTDPELSEYQAVEAVLRARGVEWKLDPTTERIEDLMDLLGSPQRSYPVIHVAGTNGKTSTARLIDTLLTERGLRVGRCTSPELRSLRERIVIDGETISEERFVEAYQDVLPFVQLVDERHDVKVSIFEVLTAMAYAAFADAPVDVAVVEVGMGGTWDATNVVDGVVSVITPIGLDHTKYLGESIAEIAAEKAGIIKAGSIAVIAQQPVEAAEVLLRRVGEVGATAAREGIEFGVLQRDLAVGGQMVRLQGLQGTYGEIFLPLFGEFQASNAACALAAVEAFAGGAPSQLGSIDLADATRIAAGEAYEGDGDLDPALVRSGFAKAASPGRLEVVRTGPTVLLDAAHNPAGMAAAVAAVTEEFAFTRLVGVLAVAGDKDVVGLLDELEPVLAELVVTRNSSARSMAPEELAEVAEGVFGEERVHLAARLDEAIDRAIGLAEETGEFQGAGVLITGSVVTAGDARTLLRVGERR